MMDGDVHIVTSMDAIINPDNVKPGIDLKELERRMISGGLIQQKTRDPQDRFKDELAEAAKKLGIDFKEFAGESAGEDSQLGSSSDDDDDDDPPRDILTREDRSARDAPTRSYIPMREPLAPASDHDDDEDEPPSTTAPLPFRSSFDRSEGMTSISPGLFAKTQEQERRSHIAAVIGDSESNLFSFENEKREEQKYSMLSEIDFLISSLANEDIDLERLPKVDRTSAYEEVESVLRMLRHKHDRARCCTLAEELMLFGAHALEELFNGKRTWFNRYQPDLTGWHNHMNIKLQRMRHDTGQVVSNLMQEHNLGPLARIAMELVPSMILYSKMRKQQHAQQTLFSDADMRNASISIRNIVGKH